MGSVIHHQARSAAFLDRARSAGTDDVNDAAAALRRSACHAATALAVHAGMPHNTRRRLEIALHAYVAQGQLSRSHIKTFRQLHSFPEYLASAAARPGKTIGGRGCPLRRLRRRVAALLNDVTAIIAGNPRPVRYAQRWLRGLPPCPERVPVSAIVSVRDILDLPNYQAIRTEWELEHVPLLRVPDPHGWYQRGAIPSPCPCHPETWKSPTDIDKRFPLSPIWKRVLEHVLGIPVPDVLAP